MKRIAVAHGDGIGPEIMDSVIEILQKAQVPLEFVPIEIGEKVYLSGVTSGIAPEAWAVLKDCRVLLKAPITTPQGGGYKSLNVTLRKTLGLFANVRPVRALHPHVPTRHPELDVVIVRENEEDLYAGIEHRQTQEVYQCLKLISRPGCERIVRYAFEYARVNGRKKVSCMTKDNIMKATDGLFHKVFDEVAKGYPDIMTDHWIIDIGTARMADTPGLFDVVVLPNLYGDILSDVVAQIAGSVGLAGSANIGADFAMFEAIHGSAPDIAGKGLANPSGLLQSAVMMLLQLGLTAEPTRIQNAWLKTLEDGCHTRDMARDPQKALSTQQFTQAVVERLGQEPRHFVPVHFGAAEPIRIPAYVRAKTQTKALVGVDVFVEWAEGDANALARMLQTADRADFSLNMITNRGVKVWPQGFDETFCTDHWRCRFLCPEGLHPKGDAVAQLLLRLESAGLECIKTENLYTFDAVPGYSLGQGQ
ncbi:NADP-dependent isocitrate dehydrogenase [bacterium]|nr:NADP-dependent isocitrate dehydrogenase [bacterium]